MTGPTVKTRVVNIRHEQFNVYIGRAGHGHDGRWGNPFTLRDSGTRESAINRYRSWLWGEVRAGRISVEKLAALSGKTLGCFCKPLACHGDVLAVAADWAAEQRGGNHD